ncbi:Perlucin [Mizuhopecten yessoensis]|uniref:Perlucin n=1 Tax=Mizuhopecten yessoensis TaxID=6573 RepID=A0A210PLH9_MIZYE|nr:Perlucin [Mizuhopecten yessoensis]
MKERVYLSEINGRPLVCPTKERKMLQHICQRVSHIEKHECTLTQTGAFGFWTSGQDEFSEGHFLWTTDLESDPFNYTSWHSGQPNNIGGHQNCVLLQYANDNYNWGDVDCGERHPFICESEYS